MSYSTRPVAPAQPNKYAYPVTDLQLFKRYTRILFVKDFGEQPPAYDPTQRIKRWADTSALLDTNGKPYGDPANELIQYNCVVDGVVKSTVMTRLAASQFNLPGTVVYPKYENSDTTTAIILAPDGAKIPFSGFNLVDPDILESVVAELNSELANQGIVASASLVPADRIAYPIIYGTETRRQMNVVFVSPSITSQTTDGAALVRERFAKGLWVPGHWTLTSVNSLAFVPEVVNDGEQDLRPEIPIPIRPLMSNEVLKPTIVGIWQIIRTDISDVGAPVSSGSTSCMFSGVDSKPYAMLAAIYNKVVG